jgi:hypothetical protein
LLKMLQYTLDEEAHGVCSPRFAIAC